MANGTTPNAGVPPQNLEAEESVLGAMMVSQATIEPVLVDIRLKTEDFYRDRHRTIFDAIIRLNKERGYTFCVIEHDMDFIGRLCDPVIVMAEGKVLAQGTVDQVKNDERVIEAYLGTGLKNKVVAHG